MNDESETDVNPDDSRSWHDGKWIPLDPESAELFVRLRKERRYSDQIAEIAGSYLKHKRKIEETPGDLVPAIEIIYRAIYNYLFRNVSDENMQRFWNGAKSLKAAAEVIRNNPSHFISLMGESMGHSYASSKAVEAIEAMADDFQKTPKPPERSNLSIAIFLGRSFANEPAGLSQTHAVEIAKVVNGAINQALTDNVISRRTAGQIYIINPELNKSNFRSQLRKGEQQGRAFGNELE